MALSLFWVAAVTVVVSSVKDAANSLSNFVCNAAISLSCLEPSFVICAIKPSSPSNLASTEFLASCWIDAKSAELINKLQFCALLFKNSFADVFFIF